MVYYHQQEIQFKTYTYVKGVKTPQQILQDVQDNPTISKEFCERLKSLKHITREDLETRLD